MNESDVPYETVNERITTVDDGPHTVNERLSPGGPGPEGQLDTVTERLSGSSDGLPPHQDQIEAPEAEEPAKKSSAPARKSAKVKR